MRRHATSGFLFGVVTVTVFGLMTSAAALWAANGAALGAPVRLGTVSFAAASQDTLTPVYSPDGTAVSLTLPGSFIVGVMDQTGPTPAPLIWRFATQGYAAGSAGMDVDVEVADQVAEDGTTTDLSSGEANPESLLAYSTLKVYPAGVNGDCSGVPDVPVPPSQAIYLFDTTDHVLQAPDAYDGTPSTQDWCAALDFNNTPDAAYANEVEAIGTGDDSTVHNAIDSWAAVVAYPPALPELGTYVNRADVEATADDSSRSHAWTSYNAIIYPDPTNEPDVTITLRPSLTHPDPGGTAPSSDPSPSG